MKNLGRCKTMQFFIDLTNEAPIYRKRHRLSKHEWELIDKRCRNLSFGLATKAKGLQGCEPKGSLRIKAEKKPGSHITYSRECKKVWGSMKKWTFTLLRQLPLWEDECRWTSGTSKSDFRGQNSMACGVSLYHWKALRTQISKMSSHCSFEHLKHKLWPKEGPRVKLPVWLPTRKSQKSTWFTWLQRSCNILFKSSQQELQLCFRSYLNPRFVRKVMGVQSCRSPNRRDFETLTRESQERKVI